MLRPTNRITDRGSFFRTGCRGECLCHFKENVLRNPTEALDHFRRIARKMTLQYLGHAPWMLQTPVLLILSGILRLTPSVLAMPSPSRGMPGHGVLICSSLGGRSPIQPALGVVLLLFRIPSREEAIEVFGVSKIFPKDHGRVRVVNDIVVEPFLVLKNEANQPTKKKNVATGA